MSLSVSTGYQQNSLLKLLQAARSSASDQWSASATASTSSSASASSAVSSSDAAATTIGLSVALLSFLSQLRGGSADSGQSSASQDAGGGPAGVGGPPPGPPPGAAEFGFIDFNRQFVERQQPAIDARNGADQPTGGAAVVEFVVERLDVVDQFQRLVVLYGVGDRLRCRQVVAGAQRLSRKPPVDGRSRLRRRPRIRPPRRSRKPTRHRAPTRRRAPARRQTVRGQFGLWRLQSARRRPARRQLQAGEDGQRRVHGGVGKFRSEGRPQAWPSERKRRQLRHNSANRVLALTREAPPAHW